MKKYDIIMSILGLLTACIFWGCLFGSEWLLVLSLGFITFVVTVGSYHLLDHFNLLSWLD